MTDEEKAVIAAARAWVNGTLEDSLLLMDAVQALDAAEPARRDFWVSYLFTHAGGKGEASGHAFTDKPISLQVVQTWADLLARNLEENHGARGVTVAIRSWIELEA